VELALWYLVLDGTGQIQRWSSGQADPHTGRAFNYCRFAPGCLSSEQLYEF
jgi:hypothetical protein